ncbi:response regulator [Candidatus Daviesbacteria bacterium]|nr:response regulator [Candidatus Daviesbacteria bacterium]
MDNNDLKTKQILLVEDELFIRELYERTLSQSGFTIITAVDGLEALELAKKKPDLILLDIMLPKVHGLDVLKKLKSDNETKNIPVVLITNLGQESIIKEAFNMGAQGYLMKSRVTPYEILEQVKNFLVNPSLKMDFEI